MTIMMMMIFTGSFVKMDTNETRSTTWCASKGKWSCRDVSRGWGQFYNLKTMVGPGRKGFLFDLCGPLADWLGEAISLRATGWLRF